MWVGFNMMMSHSGRKDVTKTGVDQREIRGNM